MAAVFRTDISRLGTYRFVFNEKMNGMFKKINAMLNDSTCRSQCGYQHRDVEYLAIAHAGLHLLRKEENQFQIMQTLT